MADIIDTTDTLSFNASVEAQLVNDLLPILQEARMAALAGDDPHAVEFDFEYSDGTETFHVSGSLEPTTAEAVDFRLVGDHETDEIGTVKWFNTTKGYGFIAPQEGGKDVFAYYTLDLSFDSPDPA